jgi:hypothetical protein
MRSIGLSPYLAFKEWYPKADPDDVFVTSGYIGGALIVHMLEASGDNLTRENLLKQAFHLKTSNSR